MGRPTPEALSLYRALIKRKIICKLEDWDGYKTIDITIPWARMDIEIDGMQHYFNPKQMYSDSTRSYYSATKDGFYTTRIPNVAIQKDVDGVARTVADVAWKRYHDGFGQEDLGPTGELINVTKLLLRVVIGLIIFSTFLLVVLFMHG